MSPSGLVDVIHWLEGVFDRLGLKRSYGGAVAYNYYGPPRLTQDVDLLALIPDIKAPGLVEALQAEGCLSLGPPARPLELKGVLDDLRGKGRFTLFLCRGVPVELFVPWHPFHQKVLDRSPERDLEGRSIRIHSAEDIIVFKKIFDRGKDILDIKAILMAQKGRLDTDRMLADAEQLLTEPSLKELRDLVDACR